MLGLIIDLYSLLVLVAVALSWVRLERENPVARITGALVEPVLAPMRRVLPNFGGLDLSPMLLLLALRAVRRLVTGS